MNIDFAFICDYAEAGGKINALGIGFDTIFTPNVPVKHPMFTLVFQLHANIVETGEKNIKISLIDEDGKTIIPDINGKFTIPKPPEGTDSKGRVVFHFSNVEFPKYGMYSIHAVIEGLELISIPIRISPPPKSA